MLANDYIVHLNVRSCCWLLFYDVVIFERIDYICGFVPIIMSQTWFVKNYETANGIHAADLFREKPWEASPSLHWISGYRETFDSVPCKHNWCTHGRHLFSEELVLGVTLLNSKRKSKIRNVAAIIHQKRFVALSTFIKKAPSYHFHLFLLWTISHWASNVGL